MAEKLRWRGDLDGRHFNRVQVLLALRQGLNLGTAVQDRSHMCRLLLRELYLAFIDL